MSDCLRYGGVGLECATVKLNPGVPRTLCPVCAERHDRTWAALEGLTPGVPAPAAATVDVQEIIARLALVEAQLKVERAKVEAIADALTRLRDLLALIDKLGGV